MCKSQWLEDPSQINEDKHNNLRSDTSRNFWYKEQKYVKGKMNELEINSGNKKRHLQRGINESKKG